MINPNKFPSFLPKLRQHCSSSNVVIEQVHNEKERHQSVRPAWLACREFIRAPPRPHQRRPPARPAPPSPFFSLSPLLSPPLVARGSGHGSGLQPPTYARARASSGPPSSFLRVDFLLSQSPPPSPASSIKRASLDPGGRNTGTSSEERSENEMRLKKQGAPAPLARAPDEEEWEY